MDLQPLKNFKQHLPFHVNFKDYLVKTLSDSLNGPHIKNAQEEFEKTSKKLEHDLDYGSAMRWFMTNLSQTLVGGEIINAGTKQSFSYYGFTESGVDALFGKQSRLRINVSSSTIVMRRIGMTWYMTESYRNPLVNEMTPTLRVLAPNIMSIEILEYDKETD